MRALIMTMVLAAAAIGGYFVYRNIAPPADAPALFEEKQAAAPARAEDCLTEHAVYEYNDDRRLELRFRRRPRPPGETIEMAEFEGRRIGNMDFIVRATSFSADYAFVPVQEGHGGRPAYQAAVVHIRPEAGEGRMPVYLFDSQMHYVGHLPRNDTPAAGYIFIPDLIAQLHRHRIDQPPGVFRFQRCEAPAAAP